MASPIHPPAMRRSHRKRAAKRSWFSGVVSNSRAIFKQNRLFLPAVFLRRGGRKLVIARHAESVLDRNELCVAVHSNPGADPFENIQLSS